MRSEALYLCDIVESIDAIASFIENTTWDQFVKDEVLKNAVLLKLLIVGEAASHLSKDFKAKYSPIPWKEIIGFRNFAIHTYFAVKWDIVWETASVEVNELRDRVVTVIKTEFPEVYRKFHTE